jgi:hypothetical protein
MADRSLCAPYMILMFKPAKAILPFIGLLSLGACDRQPAFPAPNTTPASNPVEQEVKLEEYDVRLAAAYKRINELERQVGALESTPEKIDLDLLTQRVAALEVKSAGDEAMSSQPSSTSQPPAAKAAQAITGTPRARRSPIVHSKLSLPDLEKPSRLATPAEAKAFSARK